MRRQADFLFAFPRRGRVGRLAGDRCSRPAVPTARVSTLCRYCLIITTRPSSWMGISTTHGRCRTISTLCSVPFGKLRVLDFDREDAPLVDDRHRVRPFPRYVLMLVWPVGLLVQLVDHALQIGRQLARELHPPAVGRVAERQTGGVKKRPIEMRHRAQIARLRAAARRRRPRRPRPGARWRSGARESGGCGRCGSPRGRASAPRRTFARARFSSRLRGCAARGQTSSCG